MTLFRAWPYSSTISSLSGMASMFHIIIYICALFPKATILIYPFLYDEDVHAISKLDLIQS